MIHVKNLSRVFRSTQKGEGFKESLKLIFSPRIIEHQALRDINFTIQEGEFIGLIGANGAGKTTLLKILSGLIPPSSGEAVVMGTKPFSRTLEFRKKIALVMGQKAQLWWDLPAIDAFDLLRAIYEIPPKVYRERLNELASLLDVQRLLQTQIRRLSLGERMKMELIGAILHWPKLIFLDEPTIGLDVLAAHKLREFLRLFHQREKATIILTSHNMEDIEKLCSRVIILKSGELLFDGDPKGLTQKGACQLKIKLAEAPSLEALAQSVGLQQTQIVQSAVTEPDQPPEYSFHISNTEIIPLLQELLKHYSILNMSLEEEGLESVIQRIYSSEGSL